MTSLTTVEVTVEGGVARVVLNRPEVYNAFDSVMAGELAAVWERLRLDDEVRVVVLTGAGDRSFCSGYDRGQFDRPRDPDDRVAELITAPNAFKRADVGEFLGPKSAGLWKPVVAAVNGIAAGGAFYLLGESDIIIAAETATFFDPHVTFGMPAVFEPLQMLSRMPLGEVLRMTLLGNAERISARRALEIGLVSEVVAPDELAAAAHAVAAVIAESPALAVQATLRSIWLGVDVSRSHALSMGNALVVAGTDSGALAEGQQSFRTGSRRKWRLR